MTMFKSIWQFFFPLRDKENKKHPEVTDEMRHNGFIWALFEGEWREVCEFCHGNCGQCGITGRVGNIPASMQAIIDNGNWASGKHAGLPRG